MDLMESAILACEIDKIGRGVRSMNKQAGLPAVLVFRGLLTCGQTFCKICDDGTADAGKSSPEKLRGERSKKYWILFGIFGSVPLFQEAIDAHGRRESWPCG
jgi:hypothetical protein